MTVDDEFEQRLHALFLVEAREHIEMMASMAVSSDPAGDDEADAIESMHREAHSLKGAARSVGARAIERVSATLETLLSGVKRGDAALSSVRAVIIETLDTMAAHLDEAVLDQDEVLAAVIARLETSLHGSAAPAMDADNDPPESPRAGSGVGDGDGAQTNAEPFAPANGPAENSPVSVNGQTPATLAQTVDDEAGAAVDGATEQSQVARLETVRVATGDLDQVLAASEALLGYRLRMDHQIRSLDGTYVELEASSNDVGRIGEHCRKLRAHIMAGDPGGGPTTDALLALVSELETDGKNLRERELRRTKAVRRLLRDARDFSRMYATTVAQLVDDAQRLAQVPCGAVFERYKRTVRALSRDLGKRAELRVEGGTLEFDRRVLDELGDALTHLIRNAIDHGIESPAERTHGGKPPVGVVVMAARPFAGGVVEVVVEDDGRGIDPRFLAGSDPSAVVFESGVTSRSSVSDISGHGLGLAIVKEKAARVGGSVRVESPADGGTRFVIQLPSSHMSYRCMLLRCGDNLFAIPLDNVERVVRVRRDKVITVEGRETIDIGSKILSYTSLAALLQIPPRAEETESPYVMALIVSSNGESIGCSVDEVLGVDDYVIRDLGSQLRSVPKIAAITFLGSGEIVPVLNASDLVDGIADGQLTAASTTAKSNRDATPNARHRILVVEDSITSRTLLRGVLEDAGYRVVTAVDGLDGLARLRERSFDLVVSDVEMPNLGGFELTETIRADEQLRRMPVILVTTLDSPKEREHGLLVGANAYLLKSGFDQQELISTIGELLS